MKTRPHVVLTGATGFVGSYLLKELRLRQIHLTLLGRKRPEGWDGNFRAIDLAAPKQHQDELRDLDKIDLLIHAAGSLLHNCHDVNHLGTRRLLETLQSKTSQWMQLSSAGVYRNIFSGEITESTPEQPSNPYEQSKLEADREVARFFPEAIYLRPTMVAGPGMKGSPIRVLASAARRGILPKTGEQNLLNLVSVQDVASVAMRFFEDETLRTQGGTFLLSDDLSMPTVLQLIRPACRPNAPIVELPQSLLWLTACLGSLLRSSFYNFQRHQNLYNRCTFSSSKLDEKCPGWRRHGSRQAVIDVLAETCPPRT